MNSFLFASFLFLFQMWTTETGNILLISPINSKSHNSIYQKIASALVSRGHRVTLISNFKSKSNNSNYTEILIPTDGMPTFVDSISIEKSNEATGFWFHENQIIEVEKETSFRVFKTDFVQSLLHSNTTSVDLLIVEIFYVKYYNLLASKLNISLIGVLPPVAFSGIDSFIGNPFNPSTIPLILNGFSTEMNFFERLINSVQFTTLLFLEKYKYDKNLNEDARKYFSLKMNSVTELNKRIALVFYNNHFSFLPRPAAPNAIDIGGIHIEEAKKLPKDIEEFLTNSKHGVIFFSFGSALKMSTMSREKLNMFLDIFRSIPQNVLWRVDDLNITYNLPSNVKLSTWFPQRDILEQEKVLAFISHCGLFGVYEAIHTATPVIGIPFVFDQFLNAKLLTQKNVGIYLDYYSLNRNILMEAIDEIINNTRYKENMLKLSKVFKDRPRSPIQTAVYWIEYVLKYQGTPFMRISGADMPLFKYLLLDVIAFILILGLLILYAILCIYRLMYSYTIKKRKMKIK